MERIEKTILQSLLFNESYLRKVYPFLKAEYFSDSTDKQLFKVIAGFVEKYNSCPTKEAILISLQNEKGIHEDVYDNCLTEIGSYESSETVNEFLVDETEKFCKDRAVYLAIMESINIMEGKNKTHLPDVIPSLLQEALAVAFNTDIGHDYEEMAESRYDFYNQVDERVPFSLELLNKISKGGVPKKTLTCVLAPTGAGKTAFMTDWGSYLVSIGVDVLYITLEMAEERIAERNDANLMDIPLDQLKKLSKASFMDRIKKIFSKSRGRLIIKEYPTSTGHVGHFKALLNELKIKKKFVPKIIFVDYINICASQRYKSGSGANSYTIIKAIAEELRGLAVEYNLPVVTATQVNRDGMDNSDLEMTNTSESMGLPMSLDLFFALIPTEELEQRNQIMVKILKNRFADSNYYKRFVVGIDRSRMKLYDVEDATSKKALDVEKNVYETESVQQMIKARPKPGAGFNLDSIKY